MFVSDKASQLFVCQKIVWEILVKDSTAKNTENKFLKYICFHLQFTQVIKIYFVISTLLKMMVGVLNTVRHLSLK